jgi:hypothetical protein
MPFGERFASMDGVRRPARSLSMKPSYLTAGTVLVAVLGTLVPILLALSLVACSVPPAPQGARAGCDRNGDYEQRVAC